MTKTRAYQVKQVSAMTGVSVRALHHYDEIGLLVPSARSRAGYRLYGDRDLLRLQQIMIGRELGLSLEHIRASLDDPEFDLRAALLAQREQLAARAQRTADMLRAIDAALSTLEGASFPGEREQESGSGEGAMKMKDIFAGFDPTAHEAEAQSRWGHTEAYRESGRRVRQYTETQWQEFRAEQSDIYAQAVTRMQSGVAPDSAQGRAIAERQRLLIDRWFYPCDLAMHLRLADLYESDPRFAENMDRFGQGLTRYLCAAIRANARRDGG